MKPIPVTDWGFIARDPNDPYCPPEFRFLSLTGSVEEGSHPKFNRSGRIQTSEIVSGKGKVIRTKSGTEYRLVGKPMSEYKNWLKEKGFVYDGKNPLQSYAQQWFGPDHELAKAI